MKRVLVSACLLGQPVRYDGQAKPLADARLERWRAEGRLLAFCPECAAGLPTPRPPAERRLTPHGPRVVAEDGHDLSAVFAEGAAQALAFARSQGAVCALLKEGSPSCGVHRIYDGSFSGRSIAGAGLTTEVLRAAGFPVFSEAELEAVESLLAGHEDHEGHGGTPR